MVRKTQKIAHDKIKKVSNNKQQQVVLAISHLSSATNRELATHLGWEINSVTGRVNELMHKSLVTSNGTKLDTNTNRTVTLWELTK